METNIVYVTFNNKGQNCPIVGKLIAIIRNKCANIEEFKKIESKDQNIYWMLIGEENLGQEKNPKLQISLYSYTDDGLF